MHLTPSFCNDDIEPAGGMQLTAWSDSESGLGMLPPVYGAPGTGIGGMDSDEDDDLDGYGVPAGIV